MPRKWLQEPQDRQMGSLEYRQRITGTMNHHLFRNLQYVEKTQVTPADR